MEIERTDALSGTGGQQTEELPEMLQVELGAILNHSSTAVAIYRAEDDGNDFTIVEFSRAAEEIEQIKREDVVGKSVLEVFPGVKQFGLFAVFQRVWRTGQPEEHPVSIYKAVRISGWRRNYVCKLPNGLIMTVYDDVTGSKRGELATRVSEQCFRAIADYTYDWEVWVGPTGRVLWTNPAAARISGYSIKEVITMPDYPAPLVLEADREKIMRAFRSALQGSTGNEQFRMKHKEGRVLWAEIPWQPIYDDRGNSLGHRQSIRDITARKLAEQAVQLAEREKEAILDSMAEHIIHLDADTSILWANRAACEAVGLTREQVVGRFCYEVWTDWHEAWANCPAVEAMELGNRIEMEKPSPSGRTWFVQAVPVRDRKGGVIGAVEIALDITRYKQAEEALHELQREYRALEARSTVDPGPPDEA
jgi:PAS domain S-box-containing protein